MKNRHVSMLLAIIACFVALWFAACGRHGHKPPKPPTPPPPPPPAETRVSLAELRARQHSVVDQISFSWGYLATRAAANVARGGTPSMDGVKVTYTLVSWPLYCAKHGDTATVEKARAYWRQWLTCEKSGCVNDHGDYEDWRQNSMVCSLNHQLTRNGGIYFATLVLGVDEAARYGDPSKVRVAKERFLDVLQGRWWYDQYGNRITEGPCKTTTSAGDHPEPYRSRHYGPRCLDTMWTAADMGDPDVRADAGSELDKVVTHMRPGVREDGLLDPTILPEFRADTGTRCPQYCQSVLREHGLECGPGETPSVVYVWFKKQWPAEFGGKDPRCDCSEQYYFQHQYVGGETWRPLK